MAKKGNVPGTFKDMLGLRFTRLVVLSRAGSDKNGNAFWRCQCDCGKTTVSSGFTLRNGEAKSCGCLTTEQLIERNLTHGLGGTDVYMCWAHMIQRCTNPKVKRWQRYGGRGIKVCDRWMTFENFYEDMGPRPSRNHSIERMDNDGNYEPDNCRWATSAEQNLNKSSNRMVEYRGELMPLMQAVNLGSPVNYNTVKGRLDRGWPVTLAIEAPQRSLPRIDAGKPKRRRPDPRPT